MNLRPSIATSLAALLPLAACSDPANVDVPAPLLAAPTAEELFVPVEFPADFLWGAASSAYQIEGNTDPTLGYLESNWSRWEEMGRVSGEQTNPRGAGYTDTYRADLERHRDLGLGTTRVGISWERIEPQDDQWNQDGIDYYVDMVRTAQELGIQPMVTFYHWVVPRWVSDPILPATDPARDQFGVPGNEWLWDEFAEFVSHVVPHIAPYVDLYSITNEPWSMITGGYLAGLFPPGDVANLEGMQALASNLVFMTARAAKEIRRLDRDDADGDGRPARTGVAKAAAIVLPFDPAVPQDVTAAATVQYIFNQVIMDAWTFGDLDVNWDGDTADNDVVPSEGHYEELAGTLDWIGINYYGPTYVLGTGGDGWIDGIPLPFGGAGDNFPISEIGMELRPAGFVATLEFFWQRYGLPIYITENGIGDCDDDQRQRYLTEHLYAMGRAMAAEGIEVEGYYQWSLVDNFEWAHGFDQCFGLYEVDFDTLERTLRPSGAVYSDIARAGGIDFTTFQAGIDAGYGDGTHHERSLVETLQEIEAEVQNGPAARAIP